MLITGDQQGAAASTGAAEHSYKHFCIQTLQSQLILLMYALLVPKPPSMEGLAADEASPAAVAAAVTTVSAAGAAQKVHLAGAKAAEQ
jgi:hypothetical protein